MQIDGKQWKQWKTILGSSKITADEKNHCSHEIKRCLLLRINVKTYLDSILKSRDITLPTNVHLVKGMAFSSSHIWIWSLDYKERWVPKNWCFWTIVSLLFNSLSRLVIIFLTRSNRLLISWWQSPSTVILEPRNRKSVTTFISSPLFTMQ